MNSFRTEVNPVKSNTTISHKTPLMLFGSCFAENIGSCLQDLKFQVDINPFGVLFNPISISQSIERLINTRKFEEKDIFFNNDCWHSFMHHSKFSSDDKTKCLSNINDRFAKGCENLKNAEYLILTFGTSWVFRNKKDSMVVSNCHKLPASNFDRDLLDRFEIVKIYENLINNLKRFNSKLNIILTVSPVRHLSDTAEGNQLSKSILITAVHELCKKGLATYFPAYEIMIDDLRDYRFYNSDMVHPSEQAVDYIFEKFGNTYFNDETKNINSEISSILAAFMHRSISPHSKQFKEFANQNMKKIELLENKFPFLDFTTEKEHFKN